MEWKERRYEREESFASVEIIKNDDVREQSIGSRRSSEDEQTSITLTTEITTELMVAFLVSSSFFCFSFFFFFLLSVGSLPRNVRPPGGSHINISNSSQKNNHETHIHGQTLNKGLRSFLVSCRGKSWRITRQSLDPTPTPTPTPTPPSIAHSLPDSWISTSIGNGNGTERDHGTETAVVTRLAYDHHRHVRVLFWPSGEHGGRRRWDRYHYPTAVEVVSVSIATATRSSHGSNRSASQTSITGNGQVDHENNRKRE